MICSWGSSAMGSSGSTATQARTTPPAWPPARNSRKAAPTAASPPADASGSGPLRGGPGRTFAPPEMIRDRAGEIINVGGGITESDGQILIRGHVDFEGDVYI